MTAKQVIIKLISKTGEYHLLIGSKDENVVSPKKTQDKRASKKSVEEETEGGEKSESSCGFDDEFDMSYIGSLLKGYRTKGV